MNCVFNFIPEQRTFRRLDVLEGVIPFVELGIFRADIAVWWPSPSGHQMIFRRIDGDAVQPGIKSTVTAKIRKRAVGFDKGFLRNVLSLVRIMYEAHNQPKNLVLIFQNQQIKSPLVSPLHPLDQLLVLLLG